MEWPNGSDDLQNGMPNGTLLANGTGKSERGLCRFECETTTMAGCLVDIPCSLRTNLDNGVQGFW